MLFTTLEDRTMFLVAQAGCHMPCFFRRTAASKYAFHFFTFTGSLLQVKLWPAATFVLILLLHTFRTTLPSPSSLITMNNTAILWLIRPICTPIYCMLEKLLNQQHATTTLLWWMAWSCTENHPVDLYLEWLLPQSMTFLIVFQRLSMLHSFLGSMNLFSMMKSPMSCTRMGRLRRCILLVTRMTLIPFTSDTKRRSRLMFPCRTLG